MSTIVKRVTGTLLMAFAMWSSANATVITMNAVGTISDGRDYAGLFKSGVDLAGKSYSMKMTVDTSPLTADNLGPGINSVSAYDRTVNVFGETSVEGQSYSWKIVYGEASAYLWNYFALGYPLDQAGLFGQGVNSLNGNFMYAGNDITSRIQPFLNGLDFAQSRDFSVVPDAVAYSGFLNNQADGTQTFFFGTPSTLTWSASAVPEADALAMMLAGLCLLGLVARKRG